MALFGLRVIASDRVFYEGECEIVIVNGIDGECAFMAHHESEVVAVVPGEMRFKKPDGSWQTVVISNGIAVAANNRVSVLVESAERPEEIDTVRAKEAAERAREALRQKQSIQEYRMTQASLARAMSRLRGSHRKNVNL